MRSSMGRRFAVGFLWVAVAAACSSTVELRPEAQALAPSVTTIVGLPTSLDWGVPVDQRRLQRRTSDELLELTGGRAVITEELTGDDDASVQETLRALGEDAANAVSFRVRVAVGKRLVNNANPISDFARTRRLVVDFKANVEVRRVGSAAVIGTVDTITSGPANEPELTREGERRGPLEAIHDALELAVREFAPRLASRKASAFVVEVPRAVSDSVIGRVTALSELYPELGDNELQKLSGSRERFLVVVPGLLSRLGVERGDLLGVPGGETRASHAALLRAIARGNRPILAIERGGQHFIAR
jgi:hypothetical protein